MSHYDTPAPGCLFNALAAFLKPLFGKDYAASIQVDLRWSTPHLIEVLSCAHPTRPHDQQRVASVSAI